ncbi:PH domain-containing protein [Altererythrobacter sp. GH1-8]|uniref:PH domain-containing protein n=1 Tax=Altererythrobacter sp. GH1-8 TaxID=3349333 RepID=UPI00374D7B7B
MDEQTPAIAPQSPSSDPANVSQARPPSAEDVPDDELTQLDPAYKTVVRISTTLFCIPFLVGGLIVEASGALPAAVVITPLTLIALLLIFRLPARRYLARGYAMSADRLRIVRGILFRADTVVPFGRVQHIDVNQGPLERFFDIATLTLHTAGSHGAHVNLPGLKHALAMEIREEIRSHIKRETL